MKALFLAALAVVCLADTYTWVGSVNQLWRDPNNWSPFGLPTAVDDVVISAGQVLIGNWHGAQAASLTLKNDASLSVQGSDLQVGSGGLSVRDTAFLHLAAGNDSISIAGTASITSTKGVQYATGLVSGIWKFGPGAPLVFVEATNINWPTLITYGSVTANLAHLNLMIESLTVGTSGVASFSNSQVMISSLINDGLVTFSSETVNLIKSEGKGQITATTATLSGQFNNLYIPDSTSWITGTVVGLKIATGQTLQARDLRAFNSEGGIIKVFGELTIGSNIALEGIQFDGGYGPSGTINVQTGSSGAVQWIHFNFLGAQYIGVEGTATFKVNNIVQVQGELHITTGTLVADNVNASSTALLIEAGAELRVTSQLIASTLVDLDGTLTIDTGATLLSAPSAHFAPRANTTGAKKIVNNGVFFVQNGLTASTIQNLAYSGTGSVQIFGLLDLQAIRFEANAIAFRAATSRITGEGIAISYKTLTTPTTGQTVNFFGDGQMDTCTSPCGPSDVKFYQSVSIWVQA